MGKLVGDKYGIHRVIEPQGVLTQAALKIDNDMTKKYSNEIICDVISLNIDSASFTQIEEACGGDPVPSGERDNTKSVFDFNSIRFMEYVKELNQEIFLQDAFSYGGALNQNQANEDQVMKRMQKKIDAGLSWFMTQPIYSDEEVEKLGRMKQELNTKILCGIMPLVSYRNAMFIKNEMPGIQVPDEIVAQYRPDMSRAEAEDVAVRISLSIMEKLEEVADGFYFMTPFNRVSLITRIIHARKPQ